MAAAGNSRTFLIESYVPRLDVVQAATITSRLWNTVEALRREGVAVLSVRSYAALEDETYLCLVTAGEGEGVVQLCRRSGLENKHVVEVVEIDVASAGSSRSESNQRR
jgi:hypothetical protein